MASDEELIGRVGVGDQDALAELCRRYEKPLFHFLARHTGGRDVEDLYQETWLRAVRAAPRFDPSRRFSTWMFQIAVNLCRDWHRRPPPEPVEADPNLASTSAAPEARIDARRILTALPEAQRTVLLLELRSSIRGGIGGRQPPIATELPGGGERRNGRGCGVELIGRAASDHDSRPGLTIYSMRLCVAGKTSATQLIVPRRTICWK